MYRKALAIDLAKNVFEVAVGDGAGRVLERHRFSRNELVHFLFNTPPALMVSEACGTAHYWGRVAIEAGHTVKLLPAQYVKPYRRRNKTDRADAGAILEAARCVELPSVAVKTAHQQTIQALHRIREQLKATRTARINAVRGHLREFGVMLPQSASRFLAEVGPALDAPALPVALKPVLTGLLDEIRSLAQRMKALEHELRHLTQTDPGVQLTRSIPGIGLLTSTALVAAVGDPHSFKRGRQLAAWTGLTPKEASSGERRRLGRMSKQGDIYLRTLFIHGARSVLLRARVRQQSRPQSLSGLETWALQLAERVGHNKAAVAVANKLVRITWAVWITKTPYAARSPSLSAHPATVS